MVESAQKEIVLITGVTGFVGSRVCKTLFETYPSRFKVRATARSLTNMKKFEPLKRSFGEEVYSQIEWVEADLTDAAALKRAIEGVSYIIHVASPLPGAAKLTADQMLLPAVEGMKAILEGATASKVKRLIVTSSLATVMGGVFKKATGNNVYNESDVAPMEGADAYGKSKIAQEQVIRQFIRDNQETPEIVTLHPTFVVGPTLTSEKVSSAEGIAKIMNREIPGIPEMTMPSVDVRDVATAHVTALTAPNLHGKRIILNKESLRFTVIAQILDEEFRQHGYRVQTRRIGFCPLKLASYFDDQVKTILPLIGTDVVAENNLSRELLGMTYDRWTLKQSLIDMGYSLIEQGLVPDKRK